MSRFKVVLALMLLLGGAVALWLGRAELPREGADPGLRAMREVGAIQMAIERYRMDTGGYPTGHDGLRALFHRPYALTSQVWRGPYLDRKEAGGLRDPWGRPYVYQIGENGRGTAVSLGADGRPGGAGPDQDLYGAPLAGAGGASSPPR